MALSTAVYGFSESAPAARRLAEALDRPFSAVDHRRFPDGESLVRVDPRAETAILYRSLDRPNEKLVELMLAASALRDAGAGRLVLVAPYLCYMRQDCAFRPGEAVSQRVVCGFLDGLFDAVLTVDPHLHRTARLQSLFATARAVALTAGPALSGELRGSAVPDDAILVGPDRESRQWVQAVADPLGLEVMVGEKTRSGDREVRVEIDRAERAAGRPVILVDDIVASGDSLIECAGQLARAGAGPIEAIFVHALYGPAEAEAMRSAGITRLRSTDSVSHPSNAVPLAPLLAAALGEALA